MSRPFNIDRFKAMPLIVILRNIPQETISTILPILKEEGLSTVEITMNSPNAGPVINHFVQRYGADMDIGAGTVCNTYDLEQALSAGASFIVTPNFDRDVVHQCKQRSIPAFVGAMTPTEVYQAWLAGATMVKLFPAHSLGSKYLSAIRAPFNQIPILATGGVNIANMEEFWLAGARGFGIGTPLLPSDIVEKGNLDELRAHVSRFVTKMRNLTS